MKNRRADSDRDLSRRATANGAGKLARDLEFQTAADFPSLGSRTRSTRAPRVGFGRRTFFPGCVIRAVCLNFSMKRHEPPSCALHQIADRYPCAGSHASQHRGITWKNLSPQPSEKFGDRG